MKSAVVDAADLLDTASRTRQPTAPIREIIGSHDVDTAYAVQEELNHRRAAAGAVVVGRKIGLTSQAVQRQLGVDQPDFGVLFADMDVSCEAEVKWSRLLQPKAEAEIAFVLAEDLHDDDLDHLRVRNAIQYAVAALEIVDSRIADWDLSITDTVADNASSGLFVLGDRQLTLDEFEPRDVGMRMFADDVLVSEGVGADCLGDPLNAMLWLARTAKAYGTPLCAGQVVLSGALGPMVAARPGVNIRADIAPLGTVTAAFSIEMTP